MDCQEFLALFSEFIDGRAGEGVSTEMEAHRSACDRCRHYSKTFEAGRELLRGLPAPEMDSDFHQLLDHRISHQEELASLASPALRSGATIPSILAVAVLVAVSAWAPTMGVGDQEVDLPAVVVAEPPVPSFTPAGLNPTLPRSRSFFTTTEFQDGIWADAHDLFREFSPVLDNRRARPLVRVGIE